MTGPSVKLAPLNPTPLKRKCPGLLLNREHPAVLLTAVSPKSTFLTMQVIPIRTKTFKLNNNLLEFIKKNVPKVPEKSVIVITSKIVSLAQGRVVKGGEAAKISAVKKEAERFIKTRWCYLALKEGHWCPNGGIDASNADGRQLILWPHRLFEEAKKLRLKLRQQYRVKKLGILITDSRSLPLRAGIMGVALAYAGFSGLKSYVGKKDIFGRRIKMSRVNVADSLAVAAVLSMGEGAERQPLALITEAPIKFTSGINPEELQISPKDDLYRPLYRKLEQNEL